MQTLNTLNRDQISKVVCEATVKAELVARRLDVPVFCGGKPEVAPSIWALVGVGQEISNWCCESRFTLKQLRSVAQDYLRKVEVLM